MGKAWVARGASVGVLALALAIGAAGLSGCGRGAQQGGASNPSSDGGVGAASSTSGGARSGYASGYGGASDSGPGRGSGAGYGGGEDQAADRAPVPMFHGEPMWSENRRHTAQENAEYHFQRAGADLGAKTLDEFLTKVHDFGDHPPAGALSLTRPNGDKLLFDPKSDVFAVFTRDGAPRTIFKPTDGMAYWNEQKARLASGDSGYGGGRGGYGGRSNGGGGGGASGGDAGGDQGA